MQHTNALKTSKNCIAHYTSAENALNIIKNKQIWLRNAAVMNDHSEIQHGRSCLDNVLENQSGKRFFDAIEGVQPGARKYLKDRYSEMRVSHREDVFMASLCEHDPADSLGKLSMWRAYGGATGGIALILAPYVVTHTTALNLGLNASPVLYGGIHELSREIDSFSKRIEINNKFLKSVNRRDFLEYIEAAINFAMLSIKHKGFEEEDEWRILFLPKLYGNDIIKSSVECVRGVPQMVYKVPFGYEGKMSDNNGLSLELNHCLKKVIIGPCLYPETVRRAFENQLTILGFEQAHKIISVSEIPLRQWG